MGQSLLKMNSNMLIVLSLVAAALCAPQVQENVEEIEAFRHDWLEQMEYKELPEGDAGIAERNNEQFAEDYFPKETDKERRKRSLNTNALSSPSELFEEHKILTSGPSEDFAQKEDDYDYARDVSYRDLGEDYEDQ